MFTTPNRRLLVRPAQTRRGATADASSRHHSSSRVAGFNTPDESLLALVSQGHQDRLGLIDQVPKRVPVYIGEAAHDILKEAAFFSVGVVVEPARFLRYREPLSSVPSRSIRFLTITVDSTHTRSRRMAQRAAPRVYGLDPSTELEISRADENRFENCRAFRPSRYPLTFR
jgi:hypothetical protein